jgi:hypothetical protein
MQDKKEEVMKWYRKPGNTKAIPVDCPSSGTLHHGFSGPVRVFTRTAGCNYRNATARWYLSTFTISSRVFLWVILNPLRNRERMLPRGTVTKSIQLTVYTCVERLAFRYKEDSVSLRFSRYTGI